MKTCEICCGARTIRLPVTRRDVRAPDFSAELTAAPTYETHRVFPCPSCADNVHEDRVKVLTVSGQTMIQPQYQDDPRYLEHCREQLATSVGHALLREGLIQFTTGPLDTQRCTREMVAIVGVVAPAAVQNIQSRILAGAIDIVFSVVAEARRKIMVWGSAYGHTNVGKDQACDSVSEAARAIIDQKTKELQELKLNSARMAK